MDDRMTESITAQREYDLHRQRGPANGQGMMRRRPVRAALIGAGMAVAIGLLQARRRARARNGNQQWGQESGAAYRGAQGTREAKRHTLLAWLNDAYAMEKGQIPTLKNHAHDAKDHPVMKARLERHLEETRHHADLVRECIERSGGHVSALKTGLGTMMGTVQGIATGPARDELVKNILADSAAERLEIASYRGIITAADEIGDNETARVCRQILREEEEMSEWLEQQLPNAVRMQMAHART
jgi:ferritin-like metal-binding protein YciE